MQIEISKKCHPETQELAIVATLLQRHLRWMGSRCCAEIMSLIELPGIDLPDDVLLILLTFKI